MTRYDIISERLSAALQQMEHDTHERVRLVVEAHAPGLLLRPDEARRRLQVVGFADGCDIFFLDGQKLFTLHAPVVSNPESLSVSVFRPMQMHK
jgi:hypothetical protein